MNIPSLIEELETKRAALDARRAQAHRELNMCDSIEAVLTQRICALHAAPATLAGLPPITTEEEYRDFLIGARETLCGELFALPAPIRNDRDLCAQRSLSLSLAVIDRGLGAIIDTGCVLDTLRLGQLMSAAGIVAWRGTVSETEERIERLKRQRAGAEALLANALLDDAARERLAAEDAARVDAINAMPTRKTRGDGSQYDRYPDGRVVEVELQAGE